MLVPENPAHGERRDPQHTTEEQIARSLVGHDPDLLKLAREETPGLVDSAVGQGLAADAAAIATVGHSWGGLQSLLRFL